MYLCNVGCVVIVSNNSNNFCRLCSSHSTLYMFVLLRNNWTNCFCITNSNYTPHNRMYNSITNYATILHDQLKTIFLLHCLFQVKKFFNYFQSIVTIFTIFLQVNTIQYNTTQFLQFLIESNSYYYNNYFCFWSTRK